MRIYPAYHYKTAPLSVPSDIKHRHFRLRIGKDWVKLGRMHSIKELRAQLIALKPDAVYMSVSTWLNPELLGSKHINKAGYPMLANCILSSDFLADFDEESTPRDIIQASHYLKSAGFNQLVYIITSRGMHIWVLDFYKKRCVKIMPNPRDRISYIQSQRKKLASELLNEGVIFDDKISADPYRVARLWGSLHDDTKTICTAYTDFAQFITNYTLRHNNKLREGAIRPPHTDYIEVRPMRQKCSKQAEPLLEGIRGIASNLTGVKLALHPPIYKEVNAEV